MRMLGRGLLSSLLLLGVVVAAPETGDLRKARAYVREVKKHLLQSYIDSDRLKEEDLVVAGIRAMAADPRVAAAKGAILAQASLEDALEAAESADPDADLIALADDAARAMVSVTGDPYSHIFTDEEMNRLSKAMQGQGRDESPGLMLQNREGKVVIAYVQYGYPGYQEGIEIGDEVLEIRGKKASSARPEEYPELLRLPKGDTLELLVRRDGREYRFRIAARKTSVKDVRAEYLGQGVGYLRLTIFDLSLVKDVRAALDDLSRQGMKGLILDLRHNPGGALNAATGVADLFLPQGLRITNTVSHYKPSLGGLSIPGLGIEQDYITKVRSPYEEMPMVCLINRASASASELLAGALKDHRRAMMIGETTYGKGVGQVPILLSSMLMKRYLYLTVLRYTTPNGTTVDHRGIEPDLAFDDGRPSGDVFQAEWTLRGTGAVDRYRDDHWNAALRRLADADGFETSRYLDFDSFYGGLQTALTKDQVREEIRRSTRRRMEDEGKVWMTDLQTDRVLQRGLVEILDRLGR
ncbi:MAG TPA: S41 family peptidase [Planctomycetota bacterium]|nr:S41 family peptidase [Planctomycetota bacterium]